MTIYEICLSILTLLSSISSFMVIKKYRRLLIAFESVKNELELAKKVVQIKNQKIQELNRRNDDLVHDCYDYKIRLNQAEEENRDLWDNLHKKSEKEVVYVTVSKEELELEFKKKLGL